MDWLRRNWPDLAIGIALLAVIAGIIATLLTGGSFFPSSTPLIAEPPPVTAPAAPVTPVEPAPPTDAEPTDPTDATAVVPPGTEAPGVTVPGVEVLTPDGTPAIPAPVDPTPAAPAAPAAPTVEPVAPDAPPAAAPAPPAAAPAPATPAPATPAPATPAPATPAPATPAPPAPAAPAATAPTAPLPTVATDPEAPFRVSVGAFGNPDNAARQATTFRDAGFPVFTGTQGDLTIVLVGPYASEADALAVAARIRAGNFGIEPVIYRFQPDAPGPASSTPAPGAAAPAPAATPTPAPAATPAPAPAAPAPAATGRFLQIGAFASPESAQPLRERVASLGFATSQVTEDGLIKLLVGPFGPADLTTAQQRLTAQGIESFAR